MLTKTFQSLSTNLFHMNTNVTSKYLDPLLVVGFSIEHKSRALMLLDRMVSLILGIALVYVKVIIFSDMFCLNQLFRAINKGWNIMIEILAQPSNEQIDTAAPSSYADSHYNFPL